MTELSNVIRPYLPQEQDDYLSKLHDRIKSNSIEAWEAHANPEAQGVTIDQLKNWSEVIRCNLFVQYMEDVKIVACDDEEMDKLQSLKEAANNAIDAFVEKYRHLAPQMRPQNFVTEFIDLATVKLSTLNPLTLCLPMDFDPVRSEPVLAIKFDANPSWLAIKELDLECFNSVRNGAAKALYWKQQFEDEARRIIPIEVLADLLILSKIAANITAVQGDIIDWPEKSGKPHDLTALHSILQTEAIQFTSILRKYPEEVQHENFHYSITLLEERYAVTPYAIIAEFGPGCLCVPWTGGQTEANEENLKTEQL